MNINELNYLVIKNALKDNKFILHSDNAYTVRNTLNLFRKNIKYPELNIQEFDMSEFDFNNLNDFNDLKNKLQNAAETLPFMEKKRLLLIKWDTLGISEKNDKKRTKEKSNKKIMNFFKKYLSNIPNYSIIVIYLFKKEKREKMSNSKINSLSKVGAQFIPIESTSIEIKRIISDFFKEHQIQLSSDVYSFILKSNILNIDLLINDLNKLLFIEKSKLTIEYIKSIFSYIHDDDNLDFLNAIGEKNCTKTITIFNELIDRGTQPMSIIRGLKYNFQKILYCSAYLSNGKKPGEIASIYNWHPYYTEKLCATSKKFSISQIAYCLEQCILLENKIENISFNIRSEFELFIVKLMTT